MDWSYYPRRLQRLGEAVPRGLARNPERLPYLRPTHFAFAEDIDDYRGFEAAVIADYDARTAVERELVLRLASLLWRLRRATAIETDLLRIQAEILRDRRRGRSPDWPDHRASPIIEAITSLDDACDKLTRTDRFAAAPPVSSARQLTICFQRLANHDNGVFERLGRYETAIGRQVLKTLYLLRSVRGN